MDGSEDTTAVGLPDTSTSDEPYSSPEDNPNELVNVEANNVGNSVAQGEVTTSSIGNSFENSPGNTEYVLCNDGDDKECGREKNDQGVNETDEKMGTAADAGDFEVVEDAATMDHYEDQKEVTSKHDAEKAIFLQRFSLDVAGKSSDVSEKGQESSTYIFTCPFCLVRFKEADDLKTHLKTHTEIQTPEVNTQESKTDDFLCGECEKAFDTYELLESHLQVHKPEECKPFKCDYCGKGFQKKSALTTHMNVHNLDKHRCMVCKKYFMNEESLQQHSLEHTFMKGQLVSEATASFHETTTVSTVSNVNVYPPGPRGKHKCPYCQKIFKKKAKLTIHLRIHTGEKPFACKLCPKAFSQKHTLTSHERTHSGERPYECKTCGKTFAHCSSFTQHMRIHTGQRPYSCLHCGQKFITSTSLRVHQYCHSDTRNHKCDICPKAFKTRRHLMQHLKKTHGSKNRYECDLCGETFSTKTRLASHTFMHESGSDAISEVATKQDPEMISDGDLTTESSKTAMDEDGMEDVVAGVSQQVSEETPSRGKRTLKCIYCMKIFTKPSLLMRHQRIHTGEKPFVCEFCPKAFARKDGLILHERLHTGDKPYTCQDCGKSYRGLTSLKDHEKSHLSCSYCRKKFKSTSAAEAHERTHNVSLQCSECRRPFKTMRLLNCHMRTHEDQSEQVYGTSPSLTLHRVRHDSKLASSSALNGADKRDNGRNLDNSDDSFATPDNDHQGQEEKSSFKSNSNEAAEHDGETDKADDDNNMNPDDKECSSWQCKYCKQLFDTKDQLQQHERDHVRVKGKKSHVCGFCSKTFEKECRRITHERVHTGEKPFQCSICPKAFARKDGLKIHESTHSDFMPFSCQVCGKKFKQKSNLNSHTKCAHTDNGEYPCHECDKSFKSSQSLREHELVHTSSIICSGSLKVYICQYCQQSFRRLKSFAKHLKKHDKSERNTTEFDSVESEKTDDDDDEDDYKPEDDGAMESDATEDDNKTLFQCSYCDRKKRSIQSLELHERTHTADRPHACPKCTKRFVRKDALDYHEKHCYVKLVPCDVCDRTFRSESSLKFHKRSHVEKTFICQVCGEKLANRLAFKDHKKTHNAELLRYFYCTECPKSFGHKKSLADHIETCHRNANRVKCEHCGETFVNEGWFKKHMFLCHYEVLMAEQQLRSQGLQDHLATINVEFQPSEHSGSEHNPESLNLQSTMDCIETLAAFSSLQTEALAQVANKSHRPHESDIETYKIEINCSDEPKKRSSDIGDARSAFTGDGQSLKLTLTGESAPESSIESSATERSQQQSAIMHAEKPTAEENTSSTDDDKSAAPEIKIYPCTYCPKIYKKPSQLKIHERSHTGERPYLCNQCGKGFKIAAGLKAHEERHSGVKKYKCTECPKGYASASALQEHLDAHRGIKRYQCEECPKSFRQHQSLKEHLDVHRGFRKYQCDECPRSFSQRRSWRMHMKTHGKMV